MSSPLLSAVEPLDAHHEVDAFECGKPELTDWLRRFALASHRGDSARVYVVHRALRVVGYYALATGAVTREQSPARVAQGLGNFPVPVIVLARLAVAEAEQGHGLGRALLKDALLRVAEAADVVGARALVVQAIDEDARRFYERFDFAPSPVDPLQVFLLMKDLRRARRNS